MRVAMSRQRLENTKACEVGLRFFNRVVGPDADLYEADWDHLHLIWLLQQEPECATWLRAHRVISTPNFDNLDLSGISLAGSDLRGISFNGCSMRGMDLSNADMRRAYLLGANLEGALLEGADLSEAYYDGQAPSGWKLEAGRLKRQV